MTAALEAEYGRGPALASLPATIRSALHYVVVERSLPEAVRTSEPPGTVLPFSGLTFAKAAEPYLTAKKQLYHQLYSQANGDILTLKRSLSSPR